MRAAKDAVERKSFDKSLEKGPGFCYLCGAQLPAKGDPTVSRSSLTLREHVIPQNLVPPDGDSAGFWPITLRVHRKCEQAHKQRQDGIASTLIRCTNLDDALQDSDIAPLLKHFEVATDANSNRPRALLKARSFALAFWDWIRGFHAVLYAAPLPSLTPSKIVTPFPGGVTTNGKFVSSQDAEASLLNEIERLWPMFERDDFVDSVLSHGGQVKYTCSWLRKRRWKARFDNQRIPPPTYACFFRLSFPKLHQSAEIMRGSTSHAPIAGCYFPSRLPDNARLNPIRLPST